MLGLYENFPVNVHKAIRFATAISNKKLQQAVVQAFHRLNNENLSLEEITKSSIPECTVIFEFGIADGETFNYLDSEEMQKVLEKIRKAPLQVMDYFCAIRYYKTRNGQKTPLKFDYYMFRLTFDKGFIEVRIFHERGPRHVSPEDIVNLIDRSVNEYFPRQALRVL